MDRAEAYETLISEIEKVSETSMGELESMVMKPIENESTSSSGKRYSISISVTKIDANRFKLIGSIHDNNSYKFDLVEEKMEVNVGS